MRVWCAVFAYAVKCAVLGKRMNTRMLCAVCGTEIAYAAVLRARYPYDPTKRGTTETGHGTETARVRSGKRTRRRGCGRRLSASCRHAISLRACYAMSGTEIPYDAISLRACYAMSGTEIPYGDISLRACYAMSGTEIRYGAISLRACYAMSGTEIPYGTISLRACCAMSGTDTVWCYLPTRVLCGVRYCESVWCCVLTSRVAGCEEEEAGREQRDRGRGHFRADRGAEERKSNGFPRPCPRTMCGTDVRPRGCAAAAPVLSVCAHAVRCPVEKERRGAVKGLRNEGRGVLEILEQWAEILEGVWKWLRQVDEELLPNRVEKFGEGVRNVTLEPEKVQQA
eukprot:1813766-Rhodomonas_salina.1